MRKYEVMLVLPADADEAQLTGAVDRITKVIGGSQGEVTNTDAWGRRRLAFAIGNHTEGYYALVDFTADPGSIDELERVLHLADEVVRFKVMQKPPPRKRRDAGSKPDADAQEPVPAEPSADAEPESEPESESEGALAEESAAAAEADAPAAEAVAPAAEAEEAEVEEAEVPEAEAPEAGAPEAEAS
jgi:small subunit ribosomal protein S6